MLLTEFFVFSFSPALGPKVGSAGNVENAGSAGIEDSSGNEGSAGKSGCLLLVQL